MLLSLLFRITDCAKETVDVVERLGAQAVHNGGTGEYAEECNANDNVVKKKVRLDVNSK